MKFLIVAAMAMGLTVSGWSVQTGNKHSLAQQVTIRRDTYGVPHILAETEEAAALGLGYAQAEDHCIELARRWLAARGQEAKYLGTGVENDFRMKRFGNYETAKKNFARLTPLFQKLLHAFAAGVNLYVEKHRKELPDWIPTFDGVDALARSRWEILRFALNDAAVMAPVRARYPADSDGSNMWAIAGSRTTSEKAILLGNPHQPWPALFWEAHITVPGKINYFGATYVGLPVLRHGFNENLGWTHTVNYPDLHDIFALTPDPEKPDHYIFEAKSMPLAKKEVAVEVKGKTERRVYWDSHLGPVVHRTANKIFALKSSILDEVRYFEEWYAMNKARNLREFLSILRMNVIPMFNLAYADVDGNIFYLWNGMVPKRLDDGTDYRLDVPGDTGKYVWKGLHKLEELPQLLNPGGGYVQNCNDPPWYTSLRNPLGPKRYPSYFEPGRELRLRSQMSLAMLEGQEKFSLEDVKRLKFNNRMLLADRVKPDLIQAGKQVEDPSPDLKGGLAVLEAWDNHVGRESKGAVLFRRFWETYSAANQKPFAAAWDPKNPVKTPYGVSDKHAALKHLEAAVSWTRKTYSSESVAWGEVHRVRVGDLDLAADGAPGEYGLFHVVGFTPASDGKRVASSGDGWIMAVEFSKPLAAYSILAYGQTSNRASRHHSDQARLFANHEFKRIWFTEAEIKANLEREYRPGQN